LLTDKQKDREKDRKTKSQTPGKHNFGEGNPLHEAQFVNLMSELA